MITCLTTLVTNFIYTENQKNLTNCYTTETSILYNRNVNKITITLVSHNNPNCTVFPLGVVAQVAFQTSKIPIQRVSLTNFSYQNTTQITFTDIPQIASEQFAVLNIYSYGYITEIPIFVFREQRSSLSQCFDENSIVDVSETQITLKITPTLLCTNQFNTISAGGVVIAELQSVTLNVQGEILTLPVKTFQDEYKAGKTIEVVVPLTFQQSETLLLITAPNATLSFTSSQGGSIVSFLHRIGEITTTGWVAGDTIFWDKVQPPMLGLYQGVYMLRLKISLTWGDLEPLMEATDFDNIMYRITGLAPNASNAQQITVQTDRFDINYRFLVFKCDQGRIEDRLLCQNFYNIARNPNISTSIYLDIIFQKGSQYVHIEKRQVQIQTKDIMYVVSGIGHTQSSLQIVSQSLPVLKEPVLMQLKYTVLQNSNPISFNDPSRFFEVNQTVTSFSEIVYFDCDEKCKFLMNIVKTAQGAIYQIETNLVPGVVFGDITISNDYRIVTGIVIAIGLIIILILLITSIIGIILLIKQLKRQSKKQSKKKRLQT